MISLIRAINASCSRTGSAHSAAIPNAPERSLRGLRSPGLKVDVPVNGKRERDLRNGFKIPFPYSARTIFDALTHPPWTASLLLNGRPTLANLAADNATTLQAQNAFLRREMDASFDWDDLARFGDLWPRRLLVKGVCGPEDIARCFAIGTDAVVISNHGGRQLDDAVSPMETLPQVRHLGPVLVDGGVRRGSDIVEAVALGAKVVLLGRSILHGLAASGEAAASKALSIFFEEIDRTHWRSLVVPRLLV